MIIQTSVGPLWADTVHRRADAGGRVAACLEEAFAEVGITKATTCLDGGWAQSLRFNLVPSQSG